MAAIIEAAGLTKWYGERRGILDVDFAVDEGEVFGFLGPNGAGKTTTIFLDLPLATPLARLPYLGSAIAMVTGIVGVGAIVDAGFDAGRMFMVVPSAVAFGCAIAAVASLLAVVTLSRGLAAGITAGILLLMYLANVVATLEPDVEWVSTFSAFRYFDTTQLIDDGVVSWSDVAVFTVVAIVGWAGALVAFRRRDLAA
jgi:hypothetical protein